MSKKHVFNLILKYFIMFLIVINFAMLFIPAIRYKTLATNNVYEFSIWNFTDALFNRELERNMIVSNYFTNHRTNLVAYGIASTGIISLVVNILLFVAVIADFKIRNNTFFYLVAINLGTIIYNFACASLFVKYVTNTSSFSNMGTQGSLLAGCVVLFVNSLIITMVAGWLYYEKKKGKNNAKMF